jgi:hypothetical protein
MLKRGLSLACLMVLTFFLSAPWATSQEEDDAGPVPAFNAGPPPKGTKLPAILTRDQLWGENAKYPYQIHAYELAAKIPVVLHQQPCYCHCDRMGHNSLHSCFESGHGAECGTCMQEAYYAYLQTKKHKTATQIREGIIRGEWKQIDLQTAAAIN